MTEPQQPATFDARALTGPVDPRAVSAFAAELKTRRTASARTTTTVIATIVFVVMGLLLLGTVGTILATMNRLGERVGLPPIGLLLVIGVAIGGVIGFFAWRRARIRRYRLGTFAQANGMTYTHRIADPVLPGMIFGIGSGRLSSDVVIGTKPRFVEFGNYQYTVRHGKNSTTYRWGYVAVKLDVPLPNIVLDALGNNGFGSNLPASFQRAQQLSLEGDFDRYFTLYCPEGYEQDALYLFTPDITARFIDHAAELDVEIVDDWMFLYTKRQISTLDPAQWAWMFGVVGALITKLDQWARWRDDRLRAMPHAAAYAAAPGAPASAALPFAPPAGMLRPPPGVAPQGQRLKRRVAWLPFVILFGLMAAYFVFSLR